MDITINELKKMKSKQLRNIIREAIQEVIQEDYNAMVTTKTGTKSISYKNPAELNALKSDSNVNSITTTSGQKLKELARLAKGFKLADDNFDTSEYANKKFGRATLADIIEFFRENPGAEKRALQDKFNWPRPQMANAVVNGLLDAGVLVKLSHDGEIEIPKEPGEEDEFDNSPVDAEDFFIGNRDPLAGIYSKNPSPEEDEFTNDGEPKIEPEKIEKTTVSPKTRINDDDYQAFMKYSDLRDRLSATKSNLLKAKRPGGIEAGDIKGEEGNEVERLRNLKKSLEDRINTLVSSSEYLQNKIAKEKGKIIPIPEPITVEPEEEEDEEIKDELNESLKRKFQQYAGIIR